MFGFEPVGSVALDSGDLTSLPISSPAINPNQSYAMKALRSFLLTVLPSVEIVAGQGNRVPEPATDNFLVMTPTRRVRLSTNVDKAEDTLFYGSIVNTVMTVTGVTRGAIILNAPVFGVGVAEATKVTDLFDSEGGIGTYAVTPSQIVPPRPLAAGINTLVQDTEIVIQIDVHGSSSADNAQIATTMLRDTYAADWFTENAPGVAPLYADDPRQMPFINAEQQYEDRWIVEAHLQMSPALLVPQQFADRLAIVPIAVETIFPARS